MCEYIPDKEKIKELAGKILNVVDGELRIDILYALAGAEAEVHSGALESCLKKLKNRELCVAGFISQSAELYARMVAAVLINVLGIGNMKKPEANII